MLYPTIQQRRITRLSSILLIATLSIIFIAYICFIWSRFFAQRSFSRAKASFSRVRYISKDMVVAKSLSYQKGLRLLKESSRLAPYDAKPNFIYAEVILNICEDPVLQSSFDLREFAGQGDGQSGFYYLAKENYTQAVLKEPTNPIYHQRLGYVYDKILDTEDAERELANAVLLDPQNIRIRIYLSQYFLNKNKDDIARAHLDKVISLYRSGGGCGLESELSSLFKSVGREDLI